MLLCSHCSFYFNKFLKGYHILEICDNKNNLITFIFEAPNNVTKYIPSEKIFGCLNKKIWEK